MKKVGVRDRKEKARYFFYLLVMQRDVKNIEEKEAIQMIRIKLKLKGESKTVYSNLGGNKQKQFQKVS